MTYKYKKNIVIISQRQKSNGFQTIATFIMTFVLALYPCYA